MAEITRIGSGAPWEPIVGYCRAVKAGGFVAVSGTTSFDERGTIVGKNQMYVQARQAIGNIAKALERTGLTLANVIRTRMFVTDISRFAEVARAHRENFGANPPAATAVEVRRLLHQDMLIEIEADAYAGSSDARESSAGGTTPEAQPATPKHKSRPVRTKGGGSAKRTAGNKLPRRR